MSPSHFTKSSLSQTLILFILLGSVFGTSKIFIDGENSKKYIVLITATIWIMYLLLTSTFFCTTEKAFRGVHLYIGVLSIGVMESMYGLLQVVGILNTSLNKFSITGSYDTPTGFAIAIALTIPFGIKSYLILNNRLVCGAILLAIITICATIILSKSRTGMLMAASSAFIMLSPSIRIPSIKKTVVLFTLLACIIISLLFVKFNSTYGHFLIWYITLGLIFQRPLIGYGMNGFTAHYMISQADYFRYSDNHVAELLADNVGHPSNEFLKLACEFGILSIIAALALACFIFFCICKYKSRRERPLLFSIYTSLEGPVIFPTTSMIAGSQVILSRMNDSWEQTLASCTSTNRREYGFYIYYDYMTGAITGGINYAGEEVSCGTNASLHMGSPTNTSTLCGMFHTHTSLEYCDSTKFRNTGPTEVDVAAANQKQIPGFLYDYEAPVIHGGDSKNAPKKLYTYGQYSQRPPMN